ncbi:MAG: dipeptide epimerase [Planctomycetota bacterium]
MSTNVNRRAFLARTGILGAAAIGGCRSTPRGDGPTEAGLGARPGPLALRWKPYTLELRHTFTIATNSRTTTPDMLVEIEGDGITGYGEASMPPYLGETQESAAAFLSRIDMSRYEDPFLIEDILADIDAIAPGNPAAKAAFDIALHDWVGKKIGQPWYRMFGLDPGKAPVTSFTIGIDEPDVVRKKTREASAYKVLKVKLGRATDKMMIETIREVTDVPIRVDVNQGWTDRDQARSMIEWLAGKGVEFVEQPMPKERIDDLAWLRERSPLPIVGDEAVQRLGDVVKAHGVYDGINVKLMKCAGLREAHSMVTLGKALGMKVMLGCMTETSCAISAAAQISPLADWADLDGAVLIGNDPFEGASIVDGRVTLTDLPGIGARKRT